MKRLKVFIIPLIVIALSACGSRTEKSASDQTQPTAPPTEAPASQPGAQPAATPPQQAAAPPPVQPAPEPAKPQEPKKYTLEAGTALSVRTVGGVNTKAVKSGN